MDCWKFCNTCGPDKHHLIIGECEGQKYELGQQLCREKYQIVGCCGCHRTHVIRIVDNLTVNQQIAHRFPAEEKRNPPKWSNNLPVELREVLQETYWAIYHGKWRLAAMASRTIIERVFLDKVGDHGGFQQKLNEMVQHGYIADKDRDYLTASLDTGSAAIHRSHKPGEADLEMIMDIIEGLLARVYCHPTYGQQLRTATPPRQP